MTPASVSNRISLRCRLGRNSLSMSVIIPALMNRDSSQARCKIEHSTGPSHKLILLDAQPESAKCRRSPCERQRW